MWLISKGRKEDAMKALCWLRGWCKPEDVQEEFDQVVEYQKNSVKCDKCEELTIKTVECPHKHVGFVQKIVGVYETMTRKEMIRPMRMLMFMYLSLNFVGLYAIKPNMVKVLTSFGLPIDPYLAMVRF